MRTRLFPLAAGPHRGALFFWVAILGAAIVPLDAAESTNVLRPIVQSESKAPLNAPVRGQSEEMRRFYLKPPPAGGGVFMGWGRNGRGSGPIGSSSDAVFQASGPGSEEIWMDRLERRMDEAGVGLASASLRSRPTLVDRSLEAVFAPEPIRLGRAQIGFSPYTAIKRRNPFCLLNPIPFSLSW